MNNKWPILLTVGGIIAIIFIAVNYQNQKKEESLTDIFPEEASDQMPDIQYEMMNTVSESPAVTEPVRSSAPKVASKPAVKSTSQTVSAPKAASSGTYTIQVVSAKDRAKADGVLKKVQDAGFAGAYVSSKDLGEKGTWHRVYLGNFDSKAQADEALAKIQATYKDSFIRKN